MSGQAAMISSYVLDAGTRLDIAALSNRAEVIKHERENPILKSTSSSDASVSTYGIFAKSNPQTNYYDTTIIFKKKEDKSLGRIATEGTALGAGIVLGAAAVGLGAAACWGLYKWITTPTEEQKKTEETPFEGRVLGEVQEENFLLSTGKTADTLFDHIDIDVQKAVA